MGDRCFLVHEGEVEILQTEGKAERNVACLGPGAFFGEASILTDTPRNATVRATKTTRLLALSRADLLEILSWNKSLGASLVELLRLRDRPVRHQDIIEQPHSGEDGEDMTILKDPKRGAYFRLSSVGRFLWERLDGHHNLKDLTLAYWKSHGSFAPHALAEIIGALVTSGFAESSTLKATRHLPSLSSWEKLRHFFGNLLQWRWVFRNVDPACTRCFHSLRLKYLYSKPGQCLMALITLTGAVAFLFNIRDVMVTPLSTLASLLLIVLTHDAGHAFTTKFFGREVLGIGIGWHWISPILYIDTSDMWLCPPKQRIAVHLAGLYVNLFFAGLASLTSQLFDFPPPGQALLFSLLSYSVVLFNLMPVLQSDGQYALLDFLELKRIRRMQRKS